MRDLESIMKMKRYTRGLSRPNRKFDRYFERRSIALWTCREIIERLKKNPDTPPEIIIEEFAKKLDNWSCRNRKTGVRFSIAYDTAMDVLDLFIQI